MNQGLLPVLCPIGHLSQGQGLNVNADLAASKVAQALKANELIFFTDQPGILSQKKQPYPSLTATQLKALVDEQTVTGGMLTKVRSILAALENGVSEVRVMHALSAHAYAKGNSHGTQCTLSVAQDVLRDQEESFFSI
jgi:acetylglutamate kinase